MEETRMERSVAQGATKLTHDDFLLFPDDGKRHELIDGEHFVSPTPALRHQRILLTSPMRSRPSCVSTRLAS
jgi:hypothetical protein